MEQGFELRNVFSAEVVDKFAENIKKNYSDFNSVYFKKEINSVLDSLQFGARSELITEKLHKYLPLKFPEAVEILIKSLGPELEENDLTGFDGFIIMPQCRYVRRLVSEGTRPRLPLADRIPRFQKDPGPVLMLLEKVKTDQHEKVLSGRTSY